MEIDERLALIGHAMADNLEAITWSVRRQYMWMVAEHDYPAGQGTYYEDVERWRARWLGDATRRRSKALAALELELDRALADDERGTEPVSKVAKALSDAAGPVPETRGGSPSSFNSYDRERAQWAEDHGRVAEHD